MADRMLLNPAAFQDKQRELKQIAGDLETLAQSSGSLYSISLGPNHTGAFTYPTDGPCRSRIGVLVRDLGELAAEMAGCVNETVNYLQAAKEDIDIVNGTGGA